MPTQYKCGNEVRRRLLAAQQQLNGIDYLEVVDLDVLTVPALQNSPRQKTLLVRCFQDLPAGFSRQNVLITGGVRLDPRINPVEVLWAFRAGDLKVPPATPGEKNYFAALPKPARVFVVRTSSAGDFSDYRLALVDSPDHPQPPANFDPQLSEVEFSFKVECPSDFDCRTEPVCPAEPAEKTPVNYLAKDYSSFRRLMLDRLSVVAPDWKERNPADLGVTLVEVMAYAADQLSYYQDAVATEAYLGTARKRISLRRQARLLDYALHEGCNARTWVSLKVDSGGSADGTTLPAGTRLLTRVAGLEARVPPETMSAALAAGAMVFETMHDVRLRAEHNEVEFHTWGNEECCLPKGATRATLLQSTSDGMIRYLAAGDVLVFEEARDPHSKTPVAGDPAHRHAVRLTSVQYTTDPLFHSDPKNVNSPPLGVIQIEWAAGDALPFPLCLSTLADGKMLTRISVARGNVVLADHGRTESEMLPPRTAERPGPYRPRLKKSGVTQAVRYLHSAARKRPAAEACRQDPRQALAAVRLQGAGRSWKVQRDLLASDRFSREFVVEMEDDGTAQLRFGGGVLGLAPSGSLRATYRVNSGSAGNVGARAIAHVVTHVRGISSVANPLAAAGGTAPEPAGDVRLYAPQAFRTQQRAVTETDYARCAGRHPDVQKAVASLRWTGSWRTMFITVDRRGGRRVDADFKLELRRFLERFRLAGHDLEIDRPQFVALDIFFTVCVAPGYFRADVKRALLTAFNNRDLPDGTRGFFHPDNFTFGQPVYLSRMISTAMGVPGVQWVESEVIATKPNRFQRWGKPARQDELARGQLMFGRLEIAQLDNDPNAPENGRIDFRMEGGL